jgi:hypothetical protein
MAGIHLQVRRLHQLQISALLSADCREFLELLRERQLRPGFHPFFLRRLSQRSKRVSQ